MQTTAFLGTAHIHTPNFIQRLNAREDVRVKAVYDHNAQRGEKDAAALSSTYVVDTDAILNDAEITSVVVCSETVHHRDLVVRAANAGKHVFVEKPLAASAEDAAAIHDAVQKAGVVFQTGFFMRSQPAMQFLKREIAAGNLGKITRMRFTNCHQGALGGWFDTDWHWIVEKELAGGGGFADLGAHALDIVLWTLQGASGGPCGEVQRVAGFIGAQHGRYENIDEYGCGLIQFSSGAIAEIEASWVDPKLHAPVEVNGTQGQMQILGDKILYYSEKVEGADGGEWKGELPVAAPHAFELFWDKLEGKELPVGLVTVDEAAEESRVMAEMYRAAQS
jgi:predicted dehydrogenase